TSRQDLASDRAGPWRSSTTAGAARLNMTGNQTDTYRAAMPPTTPTITAAVLACTTARITTSTATTTQGAITHSAMRMIAPRIAGSRGSAIRHASPMLTL